MYNNEFFYYHPYQNDFTHDLYNRNVNYLYYEFYPYPYEYYSHDPSDLAFRQPIDLGKVWIAENQFGWRGEFRRRGNSNIFDARWTKLGEADHTHVLTMRLDGDMVFFGHRNPGPYGGICEYEGRIVGDSVSGSYSCPPGVTFRWSATILR